MSAWELGDNTQNPHHQLLHHQRNVGETGNTFKWYQNIYTHIYIPAYVSPQKLVTYVPVTLCHHCMSDKMTKKDLSKDLKVLSGMKIMRDALISVMREKKGNSSISRKKEKKNLINICTCPSQCCFRKCQKNPTPRKSLATGIKI